MRLPDVPQEAAGIEKGPTPACARKVEEQPSDGLYCFGSKFESSKEEDSEKAQKLQEC